MQGLGVVEADVGRPKIQTVRNGALVNSLKLNPVLKANTDVANINVRKKETRRAPPLLNKKK